MAYFHCGIISAPEIWTGSTAGTGTGTPSKCLRYFQIICCNSEEIYFSCQRTEMLRERPQIIIALRAYEISATSRISFTFWTAFAADLRKKCFPEFFSLPDHALSRRTALDHSFALIIRILSTSHSLAHSSFILDITKESQGWTRRVEHGGK